MKFISAKTKPEIEIFLKNLCLELRINYGELQISYKNAVWNEDCFEIIVENEMNGISELYGYFNNDLLTVVESPEEHDLNDLLNSEVENKEFLSKYGKDDIIKEYDEFCKTFDGLNEGDEEYSCEVFRTYEEFNASLTGLKLNIYTILKTIETNNF